ncbi:MAG TPA: molybdopterin adenylyltransferase [Candidatus Poseidoniaceae archaeon]|nr:molybdopterin adenylyltransferase [Euryarchaeota archaeon]DAC58913.1 MAG TPA: molybdopterin adenylyltransferase [Candidatus Poseidoniales archaeon]HII37438.1 molybdopterin adenylyltransferase [Candidatus Poseidoniaceae archaeon]|tara:strand:- start:993 stop:1604 length:612 start_codon:yes stop_codon:yes gene_type:complete
MARHELVNGLDAVSQLSGNAETCGDFVKIGIVTVSDRASRGDYDDEGGPAILEFFEQAIASPVEVQYVCVPDETLLIQSELIRLCDDVGCSIIVTTGGTGPAVRDVTPEATMTVCERILEGFGEQMRAISLRYVPTAILSRQLGGTRGECLIFNLPGRPKAIREIIDEIWQAVPYCVDLLGGPYIDMVDSVCMAFRPKSARRR